MQKRNIKVSPSILQCISHNTVCATDDEEKEEKKALFVLTALMSKKGSLDYIYEEFEVS